MLKEQFEYDVEQLLNRTRTKHVAPVRVLVECGVTINRNE
jgi:hypothetical protein